MLQMTDQFLFILLKKNQSFLFFIPDDQ